MMEAQEVCPSPCRAVKCQDGLSAPIRECFDITPAYSANTGAERLHRRLFRRESCGKLGRASPVPFAFPLGEDPIEKAIAEFVEHTSDSLDLYDVDSYLNRTRGLRIPNGLVGAIYRLRHM